MSKRTRKRPLTLRKKRNEHDKLVTQSTLNLLNDWHKLFGEAPVTIYNKARTKTSGISAEEAIRLLQSGRAEVLTYAGTLVLGYV